MAADAIVILPIPERKSTKGATGTGAFLIDLVTVDDNITTHTNRTEGITLSWFSFGDLRAFEI